VRHSKLANGRGMGSWFPTHFTKNVKWMGHGALTAGQEWATRHPLCGVEESSRWGPPVGVSELANGRGMGSWFPTHFTKNVKWMGHGALTAGQEWATRHPLCGVEESSRWGPPAHPPHGDLMSGPPALFRREFNRLSHFRWPYGFFPPEAETILSKLALYLVRSLGVPALRG